MKVKVKIPKQEITIDAYVLANSILVNGIKIDSAEPVKSERVQKDE